MLNITIINNTFAINENTVGVLTDAQVAEILAYAVARIAPAGKATPKPKSSTTTSNKAVEPKKTTSSTKKSETATPNLGYVVTVRKLEYEAFCSLREQLKDAYGVEYKRKSRKANFHGGFVFKTKADADKAMKQYKDVEWKVLGEM